MITMVKRNLTPLTEDSYRPTARLVSLIDDFLQYDLYKKQLDGKIAVGGKLTGAETNEKKRQHRNLSKRKTEILNGIIFPSMANLTAFLEFLIGRDFYKDFEFDEEVKQLFLGPSKDGSSIFERFIAAALHPSINREEGKDDNDTTPLTDFRFILLEMIQRQIWNIISGVIPEKFRTPELLNSVVSQDMGRAIAWISMLASEAQTATRFNRENRPVLF
jgi:hypothetical protein